MQRIELVGLVSRLEQSDQRITPLLAAGSLPGSGTLSEKALSTAAKRAATQGDFDPHNLDEAVEKVTRAVTQRRGQPRFRDELLTAYDGRCAISGCDAKEALEAAHILPYRGKETNHVQNGLLLRADIHTLFDLGLIAIDTERWVVILHPSLRGGHYSPLHGSKVGRPRDARLHPSREALDAARQQAGI
jgi:putative restriction endonuclease